MTEAHRWTSKQTAIISLVAFVDCALMAAVLIVWPGFLASLVDGLLALATIAAVIALVAAHLTRGIDSTPTSIELLEDFEQKTGRGRSLLFLLLVLVFIVGVAIELIVSLVLAPMLKESLGSAAIISLPLGLAFALFSLITWCKLVDGTLRSKGREQNDSVPDESSDKNGSSTAEHPGAAIGLLLVFIFGSSFAIDLSSTPLEGSLSWGIGIGVSLLVIAALLIVFARYEPQQPVEIKVPVEVPVEVEKTVVVQVEKGLIEQRCKRLIERYNLSSREADVLQQLTLKRTRKRIAEELGVSVPTVNTHIQHIYDKTDAHSVQELMDLLETM